MPPPEETGFPFDNGLRILQWETCRHYSADAAPMMPTSASWNCNA